MTAQTPRPVHFDLGTDTLASQSDLAAMSGSWSVDGVSVHRARMTGFAPALPNTLGPWAAALELPGLDCSALGRH